MDMLKRHKLDPYMQKIFSAKFTKFDYHIIFEIGFFPKVSVFED